jgi:hypothetical protein
MRTNDPLKEMTKIQQKIEALLSSRNSVELISHLFLLANHPSEGFNEDLEFPICLYLCSLAAKNPKPSVEEPTNAECGELYELAREYFRTLNQSFMSWSQKTEQDQNKNLVNYLVATAKQHFLINLVNANLYPFQGSDFAVTVCNSSDDDFNAKYGFGLVNIPKMVEAIAQQCEENIHVHREAVREITDEKRDQLQKMGKEQLTAETQGLPIEEYIGRYGVYLLFSKVREVLLINPSDVSIRNKSGVLRQK